MGGVRVIAFSCPPHLAHVAGSVYASERKRYGSRKFYVWARPEVTGRVECLVCRGAASWEVEA